MLPHRVTTPFLRVPIDLEFPDRKSPLSLESPIPFEVEYHPQRFVAFRYHLFAGVVERRHDRGYPRVEVSCSAYDIARVRKRVRRILS